MGVPPLSQSLIAAAADDDDGDDDDDDDDDGDDDDDDDDDDVMTGIRTPLGVSVEPPRGARTSVLLGLDG